MTSEKFVLGAAPKARACEAEAAEKCAAALRAALAQTAPFSTAVRVPHFGAPRAELLHLVGRVRADLAPAYTCSARVDAAHLVVAVEPLGEQVEVKLAKIARHNDIRDARLVAPGEFERFARKNAHYDESLSVIAFASFVLPMLAYAVNNNISVAFCGMFSALLCLYAHRIASALACSEIEQAMLGVPVEAATYAWVRATLALYAPPPPCRQCEKWLCQPADTPVPAPAPAASEVRAPAPACPSRPVATAIGRVTCGAWSSGPEIPAEAADYYVRGHN